MKSVYSAILVGAALCDQQASAQQRQPSSQITSSIQSTPKRLTREDATKDADSLQKHANIALLVGIGDYDRGLTGLPPLKYPVPDITSIAGVLKQEGYEVALLTDQAASAGSIRETFRELTKALDQGEGTFLFYFSGHGFRSGSENFLATFGTTSADLANQGLSLTEVQKMLLATGAKRRMAFIDACRNNPDDTRSVGSVLRSFQELKESEGLRILYSTAPGEVSYEDESLQHGVFSYFMLEGLRGKAANQTDGFITFDDLRDYVTREMTSYGVSRRKVQKPYQLGDSTGDFLLAKRLDPAALQATSVPLAVQVPPQSSPDQTGIARTGSQPSVAPVFQNGSVRVTVIGASRNGRSVRLSLAVENISSEPLFLALQPDSSNQPMITLNDDHGTTWDTSAKDVSGVKVLIDCRRPGFVCGYSTGLTNMEQDFTMIAPAERSMLVINFAEAQAGGGGVRFDVGGGGSGGTFTVNAQLTRYTSSGKSNFSIALAGIKIP